jgi:hypothetical protein
MESEKKTDEAIPLAVGVGGLRGTESPENIVLFNIEELEKSLAKFQPNTAGLSFSDICLLVNSYNSIKESFKTLDKLQKLVVKAKEQNQISL